MPLLRFFCFFFVLSSSVARALESHKAEDTNEFTKSFFRPCAPRWLCPAHTQQSNRNSTSAHRNRSQSPRGVLSIETNSIYKLSCAREHKIRFFKLKNKLRTMNESALQPKKAERNRMRNEIDKQTCKAVSGDTIVSTRGYTFFVGSVLVAVVVSVFFSSLLCRSLPSRVRCLRPCMCA